MRVDYDSSCNDSWTANVGNPAMMDLVARVEESTDVSIDVP